MRTDITFTDARARPDEPEGRRSAAAVAATVAAYSTSHALAEGAESHSHPTHRRLRSGKPGAAAHVGNPRVESVRRRCSAGAA